MIVYLVIIIINNYKILIIIGNSKCNYRIIINYFIQYFYIFYFLEHI